MPQYIMYGLIAGLVIPAILISALSVVKIKLFELLNIYRPGNLFTEKREYITGAGLHRTSKVYMGIDKNGSIKIVNGKVFFILVLMLMPLSVIAFTLINFLFPGLLP
jgi:hypothetical protein